jgi:hypothetical protein
MSSANSVIGSEAPQHSLREYKGTATQGEGDGFQEIITDLKVLTKDA